MLETEAQSFSIQEINEKVREEGRFAQSILGELSKVIVGQSQLLDGLLIGLLCRGHLLLEGVPGLAKTLAIKTLSDSINARFQRIQFTPDLLPADLIGTLIFDPKEATFRVRKGPIFANLVLADEVNRAPAKVQSALLEAMQERQVTIGETTHPLEEPFLVLATQNPIEQEGTYPLPEAQVDRFMLKLMVDYPSRKEEREILERMSVERDYGVQNVVTTEDILRVRTVVDQVYVDERIKDYVVDIVLATRTPETYRLRDLAVMIEYGASPRASIYLVRAAKAHAFLRGRGYVTPEDVKAVVMDVLRHRIIPTFEAEAEDVSPEDIVRQVVDAVEVP